MGANIYIYKASEACQGVFVTVITHVYNYTATCGQLQTCCVYVLRNLRIYATSRLCNAILEFPSFPRLSMDRERQQRQLSAQSCRHVGGGI